MSLRLAQPLSSNVTAAGKTRLDELPSSESAPSMTQLILAHAGQWLRHEHADGWRPTTHLRFYVPVRPEPPYEHSEVSPIPRSRPRPEG